MHNEAFNELIARVMGSDTLTAFNASPLQSETNPDGSNTCTFYIREHRIEISTASQDDSSFHVKVTNPAKAVLMNKPLPTHEIPEAVMYTVAPNWEEEFEAEIRRIQERDNR